MIVEPFPENNGDPVEQIDGKWYFWDEVWVSQHGPFATEAEARETLERYAKECL